MQIVFDDGAERWDLDVRVNNPSATVADLARALGLDGGPGLLVGDEPAGPDLGLREAGLHEGAVVSLVAPRDPPRVAVEASFTELAVVNGLDAGRTFPLATGTTVVGRAAEGSDVVLDHDSVSRRHAAVTLTRDGRATVVDLGSHNGTWVAGRAVVEPVPLPDGVPVRVGALDLEVRPVRRDDRPAAVDPRRDTNTAGTIAFNRPPRAAPASPPGDLEPPKPANTGVGKAAFPLVAILTPLLFAGVMYQQTRRAETLLFVLMSPLMAVGNAVDGKRRGRRSERGESERFRRELAELGERLAARADAERQRRRRAFPDPAEILRRVSVPSTSLWERQPEHPDFLQLRAGQGDVGWEPPVATGRAGGGGAPPPPDDLADVLAAASTLERTAVPVDLAGDGIVGIVGDRRAALALARSLVCQAAVLHGPAHLPIMVLADRATGPDWDWVKWLPHTRGAGGVDRMLSAHRDLSTRMVEARLDATRSSPDRRPGGTAAPKQPPTGPTLLVVVDDETLTAGRRAPTRNVLRGEAGPVAGIVIAATADRLPSMCTTIVELHDGDGQASLRRPRLGTGVDGFIAGGVADDVARTCARRLARYEDPELDLVGAGLPTSIRLLALLDLDECTPELIRSRWKQAGHSPARLAAPVGVTESGVLSIDLVGDGPHGLVGGTTGSGKSELLRTIVAGLAATHDPDHLTFVLIDFKGGAAFDVCARLPHTVGLVTDLDEHLAERALRCLEAELKHRERVLRAAGAVDLPGYVRSNGTRLGEPLPRLVVIIDEFATLKAELPRFVDALVGVAQRGRSLGVHLLLATQRPQGAVNDNIKANTDLRIALRVQDRADSADIVDVPDAAAIPRTVPGRAYVRLGPGEVVAIQTAMSTGAHNDEALVAVDVAPFVYGPTPRAPALSFELPAGDRGGAGGEPATDLALLVDTIDAAFEATGRPRPRRPWPDPLPGDVDLDAVIDAATATAASASAGGRAALRHVPLALADDPDAQDQYPFGWVPDDGNLVVYGIGGSGTTTVLSSLALSLVRLHGPDDLHLYALDFGARELEALTVLPHVGGVVAAAERERQTRLIRMLRDELARRRDMGLAAVEEQPMIVTLIDGWSPLVAEYNDLAGSLVLDALHRVFADGPEVRMYTIVAADRPNAVPMSLASLVRQRLALRLSEPSAYTAFGIRSAAVPAMVPGRALVGSSGQVVQIARPRAGVAAAAADIAADAPIPTRRPPPVETLPHRVLVASLGDEGDDDGARLSARPWRIPVGLAEETMAPAHLVAYDGEHALVTGPARSGRTTALLTVAAACRLARPDVTVLAVAGPRSGLTTDPLVDAVVSPAAVGETLQARVDAVEGLTLLLVDDAETVDDVGDTLARLSTSQRPDLLVVAAGRNDMLRSGFTHWTRHLRRSKLGVLLAPSVDHDGDILGTRIPRRAPVAMTAGRGYLVNSGRSELVQLALPR